MIRFANRRKRNSFASLLLACGVIAWSAALVSGAEAEEHKLDLPWAKQMTYNNDPIKAAYAIRWLGEQKTNDAEAIKLIVEHLGDERPCELAHSVHIPVSVRPVGDIAADALKKIGAPAVSALCKFLSNESKPEAKTRGLSICTAIGRNAKDAFPAIVELTKAGGTLELRYHALEALAAVSEKPEQLLAVLEPALQDQNPNIQSITIKGLAFAGPAANRLIPELMKLLDSKAERVYWFAPDAAGTLSLSVDVAEALAKLGPAAKAALPKLAEKFVHEDGRVRVAAAYAHTAISGERDPGIELLLKELSNQQDGRQNAEFYAAGYFMEFAQQGKFVDVALQAFRDSLQHQNAGVRLEVVRGLVILKPADAVKLLQLVAERDSNIIVQDDARRAIKDLTEADKVKPQP
jgi:HEAT repeat protein